MASPSGPDSEFDDPRRQQLLQSLKSAISTDTVSPTAWACLWLSDIHTLEQIVSIAKASSALPKIALDSVDGSTKMVQLWTHRTRKASVAFTATSTETSGQKRERDGKPILKRSKGEREKCHERDNRKCVLTNAGEPNEVAHIYPFSMRGEDQNSTEGFRFWNTLRMFWSEERVDQWYNAVFPHGTEACQNLICLAPHAHAYWAKTYFAIKPIRMSDDKKRLDLQFYWLPSNSYATRVDLTEVPRLPDSDQGPNLARLFDHESCKKISSGREFSIHTDDPELRPLPDFKILELQWFLHRVAAMSGAAERSDDIDSSGNDDSDGCLMYSDNESEVGIEAPVVYLGG